MSLQKKILAISDRRILIALISNTLYLKNFTDEEIDKILRNVKHMRGYDEQ